MKRLAAWLLAVFLISSGLLGSMIIQANDVDPVRPSLPISPINVRFQYVPLYFAESISSNHRYGRIEALINKDLEPPWYEVIVTDKTTGRRVIYLNSLEAVNLLRREGTIAHFASIVFTASEIADANPTYEIVLFDSYGQEIVWKFIVNPSVTDLEARFAPQLGSPGFVVMHANRRLAAAPGTSLTIGKETEAADLSGLARSPRSVPYQAFSAAGMVLAEIIPGTGFWTSLPPGF